MSNEAGIEIGNVSSRIAEYDDCIVAEFTIDGHRRGINVQVINESSRQWFLETMTSILAEFDCLSRRQVQLGMQKKLRELIGIAQVGPDTADARVTFKRLDL